MKDVLGRTIEVGDLLGYVGLSGHCAYMNVSKVVKVDKKRVWVLTHTWEDKESRQCLRYQEKLIIVSGAEDTTFVKPVYGLDVKTRLGPNQRYLP